LLEHGRKHARSAIAAGSISIRLAAIHDITASKRGANRPKDRVALEELKRLRATDDAP
jgi:hypothetical protein